MDSMASRYSSLLPPPRAVLLDIGSEVGGVASREVEESGHGILDTCPL